jgi:hypothetical protein
MRAHKIAGSYYCQNKRKISAIHSASNYSNTFLNGRIKINTYKRDTSEDIGFDKVLF